MEQKFLIFAPATLWMVHHQLDCVLGAALKNRGHDVRVIRCDGMLEGCFVLGDPAQPKICAECQKVGTDWLTRFALPVTQMSSLLTPEDRKSVRDWVNELDVERFREAKFRDWPIGKWMMWTLHGFLLTSSLDFRDPHVAAAARRFGEHAALIALVAARSLEDYQPDRVICYSGANGYYRVFLEVCLLAGKRVLVHERGNTADSFCLFDNQSGHGRLRVDDPAWYDHWRHVPLTAGQWQSMADYYKMRETGEKTNFPEVFGKKSTPGLIRQRLRLPASDSKILLVMASGDWEFGMANNFGDVNVVYDSQIDWCIETARICKKHGWTMVVRQHPLGAGTKTYPRASGYIADVIRMQPELGNTVRHIMPAENLSTYDLISIADAAVVHFTTGGAEALIRGVPTICVSPSIYRHMGMNWVQRKEDYENALIEAMESGVPVSEERLRQAFRFSYFNFYTAGTTKFSSVGIKNIFDPDFRLDSPENLRPGVDARLDEVCDHLISGSPLIPLPDSSPDAGDESRLVRAYMAQLADHRRTLPADKVMPSFPEVTVFLLGPTPERGEVEFPPPPGWRCRHQEVTLKRMVLNAQGGADAMRKTLANAAEDSPTPYLHVHCPGITLDESAISLAVDVLERPENREKWGVLFGCYVMDDAKDSAIGSEWNTSSRPAEASLLPPPGIHSLAEPMTVLSMVLWRREKLAGWTEQGLPKHDNDGTWCRDMLASFLDAGRFVNLAEPAVFIHAKAPPEELIAQSDALSLEGDLEGALQVAATYQERFGFAGELRNKVASWLLRAHRPAQAVAMIRAEYQAGTPGQECWEMLRHSLPTLAMKRPTYKDYASAVETVQGYMVPGQERFLHEKVLSLPHDARLLEIGSLFGRSTVAMAFACVGTQRQMLTVDTFWGNEGLMGRSAWFYNHWRGNLRRWGLESHVTGRPGFSHAVVRSLAPDEMFDFVFIDASHEYKDVLLDFELVWPHVKPGGWIGFHDVEPGWPGCWRVWEQTGRRLLTDHATVDTLACGRKAADVPWKTFEEEWPGYTASVASYLTETEERRPLGQAMQALIRGETHRDLEQAIANAPHALRQQFINAIPEAGDDPWLHRMLSLMLAATNPDAAARHREEALKLGQTTLAPL